ncbi:MAG: hypothetical protein V4726_01105 [Verrucomicrobiota bacterium]
MSLYPYHRQDLADWCGAACIQMVLHRNHLLSANSGQRAIFDAVRDGTSWNAGPEKVLGLLNQTLPGSGAYELFRKPENPSAGATLAEAEEVLAAVKASAVHGVLIPCRQYKHWVVVTGAFTADSLKSDPDQLYLTVNDPWAAGGREIIHGDALCPSRVCGASPEIWGPVKISDFLIQQRRGALCVRKSAAPSPPPVSAEIKTALEGAGSASLRPEAEILEAALDHYEFFRNQLKGELPLVTKGGVDAPAPGSSDSVRTTGSLSSAYHDRWQVRLVDKKQRSSPRFCVWVEMCARTLRLSRVRYVDNQPDWWAGGAVWF